MEVISLKDYAKNNNISYEAVRKQVVRFADELGEHLIKDGRQQFLDEEAVAFLDDRRKKNPIVIYQKNKDEEIEYLENQNKELLLKLAAVQDQLIQEKEKNRLLIEENSKIALLQASNEAERKKTLEFEERATAAEAKKKEAEAQAETERLIAEMTAQEAEEAKKKAEDLQLQIEEKEKEAAAVRAELEELRGRGFWARLFNKKKKSEGDFDL